MKTVRKVIWHFEISDLLLRCANFDLKDYLSYKMKTALRQRYFVPVEEPTITEIPEDSPHASHQLLGEFKTFAVIARAVEDESLVQAAQELALLKQELFDRNDAFGYHMFPKCMPCWEHYDPFLSPSYAEMLRNKFPYYSVDALKNSFLQTSKLYDNDAFIKAVIMYRVVSG